MISATRVGVAARAPAAPGCPRSVAPGMSTLVGSPRHEPIATQREVEHRTLHRVALDDRAGRRPRRRCARRAARRCRAAAAGGRSTGRARRRSRARAASRARRRGTARSPGPSGGPSPRQSRTYVTPASGADATVTAFVNTPRRSRCQPGGGDERPRHRGRRLHRLAPRRCARRGRAPGSGARRPLDRRRGRTCTPTPSSSSESLADPDAVARAVAGTELVFHLGALGAVSRSVADPLTTDRVNVHGTLAVLDEGRGRRRPAGRVRLVEQRLRRRRDDPDPEDSAVAAALAVRGEQARGRVVRAQLPRPLPARDRGAALLQRVRPPPAPRRDLRRGDPASSPPR